MADCNRVFECLRHWRHGQLQLLIPEPSEQLMMLIAHADQELLQYQAEAMEATRGHKNRTS